jgi:hypothetical protein
MMAEYEDLARDLSRLVAQNGPQAPMRICAAVVASSLADGAAVTLISDPDRQEPICATDEIATRLDELQFSLAEGPCLDAHSLYRRAHGPLSREEVTMALRAADAATWAVLNPGARERPTPPEMLEEIIGGGLSRAEVHQATGMVAVQLDVPVTTALARLRAHAFAEDRPLIDVARDVVARRLTFDPGDDTGNDPAPDTDPDTDPG